MLTDSVAYEFPQKCSAPEFRFSYKFRAVLNLLPRFTVFLPHETSFSGKVQRFLQRSPLLLNLFLQ